MQKSSHSEISSRRERLAAEKARSRKTARTKPYKANPKAILATFGVLALLSSYLLPAYAAPTQTVAASASSSLPAQQVSVAADAGIAPVSRDGFLVTRTTLEGYQPYAHLASTFANNPNSAWRWPFESGVPISSGFGYRDCSGCSSNHQGLDMNPGEGTPIQAIADGVVIDVGNPNGTFGVYAVVQHDVSGQRVTSLYAHMLQGSLAVQVGDIVSPGSLIGQVGNTGQSTGAHLHLGIYLDGTTAIDPYAFLKEKVGS